MERHSTKKALRQVAGQGRAAPARRSRRGDKPKALIDALSEELLATFQKAKLLDAYDVYQHLMDYWAETMQDDVYLIASDGWREAAKPAAAGRRQGQEDEGQARLHRRQAEVQGRADPDGAADCPPFRGRASGHSRRWSRRRHSSPQAMEELAEENSGDDGLLEDVKNDKGKITKVAATARLKEIKSDPEAKDERKVLDEYLALLDREGAASAKSKAANEALTAKVAAKYGELTEDEIKTLVVDDKWLAAIATATQGELDRISQTLTGRIRAS